MVYKYGFRFGLPMYTMVYRVISTKLTEEEHSKLLEICNKKGYSCSEFIKNSIHKMMEEEKKASENSELVKDLKKLTESK